MKRYLPYFGVLVLLMILASMQIAAQTADGPAVPWAWPVDTTPPAPPPLTEVPTVSPAQFFHPDKSPASYGNTGVCPAGMILNPNPAGPPCTRVQPRLIDHPGAGR